MPSSMMIGSLAERLDNGGQIHRVDERGRAGLRSPAVWRDEDGDARSHGWDGCLRQGRRRGEMWGGDKRRARRRRKGRLEKRRGSSSGVGFCGAIWANFLLAHSKIYCAAKNRGASSARANGNRRAPKKFHAPSTPAPPIEISRVVNKKNTPCQKKTPCAIHLRQRKSPPAKQKKSSPSHGRNGGSHGYQAVWHGIAYFCLPEFFSSLTHGMFAMLPGATCYSR